MLSKPTEGLKIYRTFVIPGGEYIGSVSPQHMERLVSSPQHMERLVSVDMVDYGTLVQKLGEAKIEIDSDKTETTVSDVTGREARVRLNMLKGDHKPNDYFLTTAEGDLEIALQNYSGGYPHNLPREVVIGGSFTRWYGIEGNITGTCWDYEAAKGVNGLFGRMQNAEKAIKELYEAVRKEDPRFRSFRESVAKEMPTLIEVATQQKKQQ